MNKLNSKITRKYRIFHSRKNLFLITFLTLLILINISFFTYFHYNDDKSHLLNEKEPRLSWEWATLDLTNPLEVNNSRFTHNTDISIEGRIYSKSDGTNKSDIEVIIQVDGMNYPSYNDFTNPNGRFTIDYTIDPSLDIYSSHELKAIPINYVTIPPGGVIENPDYYTIYVNTSSDFDIVSYDDLAPKLIEEYLVIDGYLRDGSGIGLSFEEVYYFWLDGFNVIDQGSFWTDSSGDLSDIQVPNTLLSQLTLKLNFSNVPFISYSESFSPPIKTFSDVFWDLNIDLSTYVGARYTITGQLSSLTDSSLKINNRDVEILYDGNTVDTVQTRADGSFTSTFDITGSNGTFPLQVQLVNYAGKDISSTPTYIFVDVALPSNRGAELPPFLIFSVIFFPILGIIIAGLIVYALRYYRKQEEEARVVNVPLISRIKNLKILKDSGRLEESLSYLFNAIYMDLVNAKYGRARKDNETIRDFAIVSVKELKLTPATVYPFIQKIEEVIYAKPFKITEKDFYNTCELFSPIYFQLTGYNFVLNF
ncbi:MAG: hypothetical protein ACFFAQ_01810 [Promethearchaeota archaeon]